MTDKRDIREELRIVRGNAFGIKIHVEARRLDGSLVEDFSLADSEAVLNVMHGGNKQPWEFEVEGNDAVIAFPSTLTLGWYGLEMSGTYNGEGWRWCVPDVFQIVETNMKANVPSWTVLTDDTYMVSGVLTLASGGGGTPIDAYTKAQTDALLAEKVNTEYSGERFRAKYSDQLVEFLDLDLSGIFYGAALSPYGINFYYNEYTGHIRYDGRLKVNDDAVAMASDLAGKQDAINDLAAIRSGAAAGATAVQPAELTPIDDRLDDVEYCLGDYIKEIYTFNKDNKPEVTTEPVYCTKELFTNVYDPVLVPSTITCECRLTAEGPLVSALYIGKLYSASNPGRIYFTESGKATIYLCARPGAGFVLNLYDNNDILVEGFYCGHQQNDMATSYTVDVSNGYYLQMSSSDIQYKTAWLAQIDLEINEVKQISTDVHANSNAIAAIEQKIPAQASSSNQLADKGFVNSSIATATATYRGSYNLVSDLSLTVSATQQQIADALATKMAALSITPDNNDYCFVQIPTADATPTEIARIDRYKYDGTAWAYEYSLNNSSFTAAQWAAINSGITSGLVAKLSDLPTATELAILLAGKASIQELAGKEDKMPIVQVASGTTAINAAINTYYEVAGEVGVLAITLPVPSATDKLTMVVLQLTTGANPNVTFSSTATVDNFSSYAIEANKEYEINCAYNGDKWIVADMEVV